MLHFLWLAWIAFTPLKLLHSSLSSGPRPPLSSGRKSGCLVFPSSLRQLQLVWTQPSWCDCIMLKIMFGRKTLFLVNYLKSQMQLRCLGWYIIGIDIQSSLVHYNMTILIHSQKRSWIVQLREHEYGWSSSNEFSSISLQKFQLVKLFPWSQISRNSTKLACLIQIEFSFLHSPSCRSSKWKAQSKATEKYNVHTFTGGWQIRGQRTKFIFVFGKWYFFFF